MLCVHIGVAMLYTAIKCIYIHAKHNAETTKIVQKAISN